MSSLKSAGILVIHKVAELKHAIKAQEAGVDAIAVVGVEGGGHVGNSNLTTLIKIPLAVDALKVPVIAAGGIGDARGLMAALSLGADGIIMGTRFMATRECPGHPKFKKRLISAHGDEAILVKRTINDTTRALSNPITQIVLEMERRGADLDELLPYILGVKSRQVYLGGDIDAGVASCGQIVGLIQETISVRELIEGIVKEAEQIVQGYTSMFDGET
jgi:nitronate monooxygenase